MLNIGVPGLILILIVTLVLFGPKKLPEMGRALGSSLREFKHSSQGKTTTEEKDENNKNPEQVLTTSNHLTNAE